jgi:hypothetical protein
VLSELIGCTDRVAERVGRAESAPERRGAG